MSQPLEKLENYIFGNWADDINYKLGRILTIIDASIADPEQRKGIKDLIKDATHPSPNNYRQDEVSEILNQFFEKYVSNLYEEQKKKPRVQREITNEDYFAE